MVEGPISGECPQARRRIVYNLVMAIASFLFLAARALVRLVRPSGLIDGAEGNPPFMASGKAQVGQPWNCSEVPDIVERERSCMIGLDLYEKNEYLRAANEEIVKLARSLEETNAELEETRGYLDNLIQNSADMIVSTGRKGIITLFNRRAQEVLGYTSDDVMGKPVGMLFLEGEGERVEEQLKTASGGKLMEYEVKLKAKGGRVIPARLTASLLYDRDGRLIGSVGACTDLTDIKALESELFKQQKLLAAAELGGAASHELNQPLTVAIGKIQLMMKREGVNSPRYSSLMKIEEELEKMAELIRRIGRIRSYRTKPYMGGAWIVDLEQSAEPNNRESQERDPSPQMGH